MTKAPEKKPDFAPWKLKAMTEFGKQVQLLKLDVYSSSVWRTLHGGMYDGGAKMGFDKLAAQSGMSVRQAKKIVKKLESLGFLRVRRRRISPAQHDENHYMTRTLTAPELAKIEITHDKG